MTLCTAQTQVYNCCRQLLHCCTINTSCCLLITVLEIPTDDRTYLPTGSVQFVKNSGGGSQAPQSAWRPLGEMRGEAVSSSPLGEGPMTPYPEYLHSSFQTVHSGKGSFSTSGGFPNRPTNWTLAAVHGQTDEKINTVCYEECVRDLFLTRHLMTQRASWIERSASSRISLLEPRTRIEMVLPGFWIPVTCHTVIYLSVRRLHMSAEELLSVFVVIKLVPKLAPNGYHRDTVITIDIRDPHCDGKYTHPTHAHRYHAPPFHSNCIYPHRNFIPSPPASTKLPISVFAKGKVVGGMQTNHMHHKSQLKLLLILSESHWHCGINVTPISVQVSN